MFDEHFEVFLVDTRESKEIHYSIRYQVYCEEMGFENKDNFPLEQEFDEYDNHSTHFIVRTRQTGQWVGAMRMIFKNHLLLPLEKHCNLNTIINNDIFNRSIEISRLCLVKDIRRRSIDIDPPLGLEEEEGDEIKKGENVIPFYGRKHIERSIIWGLFRAAAVHSEQCNIKKWYFLGANALARIICKKGFNLQQIGNPCNFNGERLPFEIALKEVLSNSLWLNDFKNGYSLYSEIELSETGNKKVTSASF
jgi:N-acyl amino acid synthase of PEP-CTERM/exosortase system